MSETDDTIPEQPSPTDDPVGVGPAERSGRDDHPVLVYTALRFVILALVGGVLYIVARLSGLDLTGAGGLLLLVFAFLISGVISAFALNRPREGAAAGLTTAISRVNAKIDASSRAEDAPDDDLAQYEAVKDVEPGRDDSA